MSMPIIWLLVTIAFLVGEAATTSLMSIWFAGGGIVALIAALMGAPLYAQILLFAISSAIVLYLTRDLAQKYINNRHQRTNADRVVGMEALVIQAIDNSRATGQVKVAGQVWTARAVQESGIEQDAQVIVAGIEGVKVMVVRKPHISPRPTQQDIPAEEVPPQETQSVEEEIRG